MNNSGDTLIEVLISMTVLALVLVVTFISTNRSLGQGDDATNRQTATSYAQQQIELIKTDPSAYQTESAGFCIMPGSAAAQTDLSKCVFGSQFTIKDSVSDDLFTVNANWPGPSGQDQLTLYYKAAP